jgi:hypothetical protein
MEGGRKREMGREEEIDEGRKERKNGSRVQCCRKLQQKRKLQQNTQYREKQLETEK